VLQGKVSSVIVYRSLRLLCIYSASCLICTKFNSFKCYDGSLSCQGTGAPNVNFRKISVRKTI